MGGGNNAGMRVAAGRYFFLLNSGRLGRRRRARAARCASPMRIRRRPSSALGSRTRTARCSARRAASRRSGASRPSTCSSASSRRGSSRAEPALRRRLRPRRPFARSTGSTGAALLVRREAADAVGLFDEAFFMFSEEVDWLTRFRRAGWKVLFYPGAEVVHVGGASHGGRMYVENLRGQLRFFDKHRGRGEAERARRLLLVSLRLRGLVFAAARHEYRDGVRFLSSGDARTLLAVTARDRLPAPRLRHGRRAGARVGRRPCARAARSAAPRCSRGRSASRLRRLGGRLHAPLARFSSPSVVLAAISRRAPSSSRRLAPRRPRPRRAAAPWPWLVGVVLGWFALARRGRRHGRRPVPRGARAQAGRPGDLHLRTVDEFKDGGLHPGYAFPLWHGFLALVSWFSGRRSRQRRPPRAVAARTARVRCSRGRRASPSSARAGAGASRARCATLALVLLRPRPRRLVRDARAAGDGRAPAARPGGDRALLRGSNLARRRRPVARSSARSRSTHPTYALFLLMPLAGCALLLPRAGATWAPRSPRRRPDRAGAALAEADRRRDGVARPRARASAPRALAQYGDQLVVSNEHHYPARRRGVRPQRRRRGRGAVPAAADGARAGARRWAAFALGGTLLVLRADARCRGSSCTSRTRSRCRSRAASAGFAPLPFAFAGALALVARSVARAPGRARRRDRAAARSGPATSTTGCGTAARRSRPGSRSSAGRRARRRRRAPARPQLREHHALGAARPCSRSRCPVFVHGLCALEPATRQPIRARSRRGSSTTCARRCRRARSCSRRSRRATASSPTRRSTSSRCRSSHVGEHEGQRPVRPRARGQPLGADERSARRQALRRDLGDPQRPPLSSAAVKVLLVTMYFPPAGGGGVQRPLKFATHLPELGIETHVLAPDDPKWIHRDDELQPPTLAWVHRARYLGPKGRKPAEELHGTTGLERVGEQAQLAGRRLLVPDENVSWNLTAIPAAIRIAKREGIDVVITTSPPSSVHLVGAAVKRADRHPVGRRPARLGRRASAPRCRAHARAREGAGRARRRDARRALGRRDRLRLRRDRRGDARAQSPAGPVVTIANGSDFDDFAGLEHHAVRRFRITHAGSFFGKRDPRPFLTALARVGARRRRAASSATSARPTASGPSSSGSATGSS